MKKEMNSMVNTKTSFIKNALDSLSGAASDGDLFEEGSFDEQVNGNDAASESSMESDEFTFLCPNI
jgi:hypothetical protein